MGMSKVESKYAPEWERKSSPWGSIQTAYEYAPGIVSVSTAGHGGLKLDRQRNAKVPDYMRRPSGWYEEDCEWALVVLVFPQDFTTEAYQAAVKTAKSYFPREYQEFTGEIVQLSESYVLRQEDFQKRTKDKFVAISCWGDYHENVPKGFVGVLATVGGIRQRGTPEIYRLVPAEQYSNRDEGGFILDNPNDYPEWVGPFSSPKAQVG